MTKKFYILVFFIFIAGVVGCTVNYSMGGASIEPDVKTITIENFPNRSPGGPSGMEQMFTNELKDKFQSQTSLKFVDNRGDLELTGEIAGYSKKPQAVGGDEKATKTRLTITVHVKFTNNKYPDKSYETDFSQYEDFDASQNLTDVEDQLVEDITEKLVQDIFSKAVVNW